MGEIFRNELVRRYMKQAREMIETATGEKPTAEQLEEIKAMVNSRFKNVPILFTNSYKEENSTTETDLANVVHGFLKKGPVLSGNGTLFQRECDGGKNVTGGFLKSLLDTRKKYKKQMFQAKTDGDEELESVLDMKQKVFKVLANAYYGSLGQSSFVFHDPQCAPAVTQAGVSIITTLIQKFEQFLGDNWYFECWGDAFEFVQASLEKEDEFESVVQNHRTADDVATRILSKMNPDLRPGVGEEWEPGHLACWEALCKKLSGLGQEEIDRMYYRNNLYDFLDEPAMLDLLGELLGHDLPSGNPGDVEDEELKDLLEAFSGLIQDVVVLPRTFQDRMDFCDNAEKKAVLLTDTDS